MQISAGEKFCQHCGAPVASRAATAPGATDAPSGPGGSRWLWIGALLVLVATGAALVYRLLSLRRPNPGSVELTVASAPAGEQRPLAEEGASRLEEAPSGPARAAESRASRPDGEAASSRQKAAGRQKGKPALASGVGDVAASQFPKNQAAVQSAQEARPPAPDSVTNSAAPAEPAAEAPSTAPPASEAVPPPSRPSRPRIHLLKPDPLETPPPPAAAPAASQSGPLYSSDAAASRPTLHRAPAAPAIPREPASSPEPAPYPGPSAGTLIWSGQVEKDTLIRIEGDRVSPGRLTGELPGVPVIIDVPPDSLAIVEGPSEANHYKRLYLRSLKRLRSAVVIKWTVRQ